MPDEKLQDETWVLEDVVEEEMHNMWGIYDHIPRIFINEASESSGKDMLEEFGTQKIALPYNIKSVLRYGFNLYYERVNSFLQISEVLPDVSPFENRNLSLAFCCNNLDKGVVTVHYNWDDYLFAYMLTEEKEMKNVHYKLYEYIDDIVEFRIKCNEEHRREVCIIGDEREPTSAEEDNSLETPPEELKKPEENLKDAIDNLNEILSNTNADNLESPPEGLKEATQNLKDIIDNLKESLSNTNDNILEIYSGILEEPERSAEREEEKGLINAELKVLYKRIRLKERLSYICEHLRLSSYYWKLDLLYLIKIYALEIIGSNNGDSFENELKIFLSKVDKDNEVKSVGGGFSSEECLNSWYDSLANIRIDEDIDQVGMEKPEPCWKFKLCLVLFYNAKQLFLVKENARRLDGFRYEDIEKLWENIIRLCGKEDMELQKYYFEALTGKELCKIETIYAQKILGVIDKNVTENRAEVKRLLKELYNQFHEFPNICSRIVFVREIMEPFLIYSDDVDMVKLGLKHLCELMPSLVQSMTETMENVLQNILCRLKCCDKELIRQAEQLNLLAIWERQLSFFDYKESEELKEVKKNNHHNNLSENNKDKERKRKERKLTIKDIYKEISVKYIRK